jgi:flagellar biosynthesis/type III secretory pathway ATPase
MVLNAKGQRRRPLWATAPKSKRRPGQAHGQIFSVPVGEAVLGRVIDPLATPSDGLGPHQAKKPPVD